METFSRGRKRLSRAARKASGRTDRNGSCTDQTPVWVPYSGVWASPGTVNWMLVVL